MTNSERAGWMGIALTALLIMGGMGFVAAVAKADLESRLRACRSIIDQRAAIDHEMLCRSYRDWAKRVGQQVEGMEDYCR